MGWEELRVGDSAVICAAHFSIGQRYFALTGLTFKELISESAFLIIFLLLHFFPIRSKICKVELFHEFQKLVTSISKENLPDTLRMKTLETYFDYKEAALNYQEAWKALRSQALLGWIKNAQEYLLFT
ncbi:tRNA-specific adenosine deaminase 1-like [Meleagris gallopavo]|uniref:tRNA-specific adenosine deaminase 1-like n=1 Tax=Meleagris gallopavo TaxID=9103 RepID=UPI000938BD9C|nr:tRNA-specific adenosine deaminase 1-like [Meleagris gallopavo]